MNDQAPSKALSLRPGANALLPIYPETFEDVVRLARMSIISGMIKPLEKGYGENKEIEPPEATEARGTMIIMQGMEVGLPPMQAIQLIAMINGRMVIHSEGVPALLLKAGFKIKQEYKGTPYEPDFKAVCTLTRPDGDSIVSEYSVADAIKASLWSPEPKVTRKGKNGAYQVDNDSPWHRYPKRMLWARALGFAKSDKAADVMRGLSIREEVEDLLRSADVVDITPRESIVHVATTKPKTIVEPTFDDIPTGDDPTDIPADDDLSGLADDIPDDLLPDAQQEQLIAKLKADLAECKNDAERLEVGEEFIPLLDRLSDENRREAEKIIEGRG